MVAIGKAAEWMSKPLWGEVDRMLLISPWEIDGLPSHVELLVSSHPDLSQASLIAGRRLLDFVRSDPQPLLLLLSGGASALVEVLKPGVDSEQHFVAWRQAYLQNWSIAELNAWRSQYSSIKAGQLSAHLAGPGQALIWCDVLSGARWVGSGLAQGLPQLVLGDGHCFRDELAVRIGSRGWRVRLCADLVGDVEQALESIRGWQPAAGEVCLASAEVTLGVQAGGRGGRCQHLALALLPWLESSHCRGFLAASSDGQDGPTPAAGAWIDKGTARMARAQGVEIADYLSRHDSFGFFEALGLSWQTGPTGNNLNDVVLLVG